MACVVTRDNLPVLGYSTMGGDGQAMFHTQGLTNILDYGMEIQEAIERPRFVYGPIDPGDVLVDTARIEGRVPAEVREGLTRRATRAARVRLVRSHGHAHALTLHEGRWGGADPAATATPSGSDEALALLLALAMVAVPAAASDWGGHRARRHHVDPVRESAWQPSKETRPRIEGYDTLQWVYEGDRAPAGIARMTVDFGFLTAGGYKPNLVRLLTLEPKPFRFGKNTVIQGWGVPDAIADNKDGTSTLIWKDGLLVHFDKEGKDSMSMIFSGPQPLVPSGPPRRRSDRPALFMNGRPGANGGAGGRMVLRPPRAYGTPCAFPSGRCASSRGAGGWTIPGPRAPPPGHRVRLRDQRLRGRGRAVIDRSRRRIRAAAASRGSSSRGAPPRPPFAARARAASHHHGFTGGDGLPETDGRRGPPRSATRCASSTKR